MNEKDWLQYIKSPISIPEKIVGDISISHSYIKETDIISVREAFLTGKKPLSIKYENPQLVHTLKSKKYGIWMTDLPIEIRQIKDFLQKYNPKGTILIGGLGLGLIAHFLAKKRNVQNIVIIEINPNIINLVEPYLPKKCHVIKKNIYNYFIDIQTWNYDYAFIDCWQGTSATTWWKEILPLKRRLGNKFGLNNNVHYWAKDIMLGQVLQSLTSSIPHWYMQYLPVPMSLENAHYFVHHVGEPHWEKLYGKAIDKAILIVESQLK